MCFQLKKLESKNGLNRDLNPGPLAPKARIIPLDHWAALAFLSTISPLPGPSPCVPDFATCDPCLNKLDTQSADFRSEERFEEESAVKFAVVVQGNWLQKEKNISGSGGIRTHASEETGALNQRLRPLGHATLSFTPKWSCGK